MWLFVGWSTVTQFLLEDFLKQLFKHAKFLIILRNIEGNGEQITLRNDISRKEIKILVKYWVGKQLHLSWPAKNWNTEVRNGLHFKEKDLKYAQEQDVLAYYAWPRTYPSRSCKRNPWRQHVHRTTRWRSQAIDMAWRKVALATTTPTTHNVIIQFTVPRATTPCYRAY